MMVRKKVKKMLKKKKISKDNKRRHSEMVDKARKSLKESFKFREKFYCNCNLCKNKGDCYSCEHCNGLLRKRKRKNENNNNNNNKANINISNNNNNSNDVNL